MPKLRVVQNSIDYYGFFTEPAFDLMGDVRFLVKLLYDTFSKYGAGLASFRVEGETQELSTTTIYVRLGPRGLYKLKFDQVQVTLNEFTIEQLAGFFEVIQVADEHFRGAISNLSFKSHAFFYSSHSEVLGSTSTEFLRSLPPRDMPVPGEDLGSGILQTWLDPYIEGKVAFNVDHSLQVKDGIFVSYRVLIEHDQLDYIPLAVTMQQSLYTALARVGLEFEEEGATS